MKINAIPASDRVERYNSKPVPQMKTPGVEGVSDRVELSSEARSFSSVLSEVKSAMDATAPEENERIARIAAQIENGTYNVSGDKIAEKMLGSSIDIEI